jgi:hypothetical protein
MIKANALLIGLGGAALGFAAGSMRPAARAAPDDMVSDLPGPYYAVLWENAALRLVEHRLEAGAKEPMHHHPKMVAYFLESSTIRVTESNGTVSEPTLVKGTISEIGPWTHEIANIGDTPLHSIIIELKPGGR